MGTPSLGSIHAIAASPRHSRKHANTRIFAAKRRQARAWFRAATGIRPTWQDTPTALTGWCAAKKRGWMLKSVYAIRAMCQRPPGSPGEQERAAGFRSTCPNDRTVRGYRAW